MLIYFWNNQKKFISLLKILILTNFFIIIKSDVFTAVVELENLLINEANIFTAIIDEYIQKENERLKSLKE